MNRIDRISAILIQLQSRRVVKASDIAERFDISLRTVYRDVKTLEEAGIPIIGEAGVGYSIMDGYRLPPIMFTREEAIAFLTAEKFVEKMTDQATAGYHKSAMYKIRAILKTAEKDVLETLDSSIEVLKGRAVPQIGGHDHLQSILGAILPKKVLCLEYKAGYTQERTKREVEPVGIFYLDNYWHLIAYCRMRNDYRDFRCDRIITLKETGQHFAGKHPSLKTFIEQTAKEKKLEMVVFMVDTSVLPYLQYEKYYHGFVSEREVKGQMEMTFLTASIEGFVRWFITFGDMAEIRKPDHLKEKVSALADQIAQKHAALTV